MYIPNAFRENDTDNLQGHMDQTRLAILVTQGDDGLQATHLPLLLRRDEGPYGTLYGHMAKATRNGSNCMPTSRHWLFSRVKMPT